MFKNQELMKSIKKLALPSIIEQALQTIVMYADTAMVGAIGANASAAVGLTMTINWLVNSPLYALGVGFLAFISKNIGAKDYEKAKLAGIQAVIITILSGISLGVTTLVLAPYIPIWLNGKEEIINEATTYFTLLCIPMLFRASSIILGYVLRASGDTRTPMLVNGCMNVINIILNFFLIGSTTYINLGGIQFTIYKANLQVAGAGIATLISYTIGGTLMYIAYRRSDLLSPKGYKLRLDKKIMYPCIKVSFPIALERIAHCGGQVVFSSLVNQLGTISIAAHSIALTAEEAFYIPGYGMQAAASTLCGMSVGEQNEKKLMQTSSLIMCLACLAMTVMGSLLFISSTLLMQIFTPDLLVISLGATVLRIVAVSEPLFGISIILEGVFNGVGDTKVPFFISAFTMWGVRIVSTFICINYLHLGLSAVWCCMVADNVVKCLLYIYRYKHGKWKENLFYSKPIQA